MSARDIADRSRLARRAALALSLGATALGTSACGGLFDVVYLIGNKHTSTTIDERSPTGQVHSAVEYDGGADQKGSVQIVCEDRERRIERASSVTKNYRYRGGYTQPVYITTTVLSAVWTGAIAGVIALACEKDEKSTEPQKEACLVNMLAATPFAIDMIYSSVRAARAKEPKLVEKTHSNPYLVFSEAPSRAAPVSCDQARLYLRPEGGPPEQRAEDILSNVPPDPAPFFLEGATAIPLPPDGKVTLRDKPEIVQKWADDPRLALWIVGADGRQHKLTVNRCEALKPLADMLPPPAQTKFFLSCAPPPQAQPPR